MRALLLALSCLTFLGACSHGAHGPETEGLEPAACGALRPEAPAPEHAKAGQAEAGEPVRRGRPAELWTPGQELRQQPPVAWVEGRVMDEEGEPVARAQLFTLRSSRGDFGPETTSTDAVGRFRLDLFAPGRIRLTVDAEGFALAWQDLEAERSAVPLRADFRLDRGLSISGRVLSASGLPVAGAYVVHVWILPMLPPRDSLSGTCDPEVVVSTWRHQVGPETDEEGRFVLTGLEPGLFQLEASVPGRFSTYLPSQPRRVAAGEQGIVLALGVPGGVRGVALDPTGAPLAAGRISYSRGGAKKPMGLDPEWDRLLDPFHHHDRSGNYLSFDQGAFTVDHLEPGLWRIEVGSLGYAPGAVEAVVEAGAVTDLGSIRLGQGAWLDVAVSGPDGAPVSGVELEARLDSDWLRLGRTDAAGRCRMEGLAPGAWILEAGHPEYALGRAGPFTLVSGQGTDAHLRLHVAGCIEVLVRDREGRPKSGAGVEIMGPLRRMERTDVRGLARFGRLFPGTYGVRFFRPLPWTKDGAPVDLAAYGSDPETEIQRDQIAVAEGETARLELTEPAPWTLRGIVAGPSGPVQGVRVSSVPRDGPFAGPEAISGPDGSWLLEVLPAGPLVLHWSRPDARFESTAALELGEQGGVWNGRLELPTGVIEGRVLDGAGSPVPNVRIAIEPDEVQFRAAPAGWLVRIQGRLRLPREEPPEPVATDAQGRFRVEQVPAGRWRVGVLREDGKPGQGKAVVELAEGGKAWTELEP